MPPVSSTRPCCSTRRRKFCLCSRTPASASTVRCNCSSVKAGGISSNTTGRYFDLAPQAADCGGQDAPVVGGHRRPRCRQVRRRRPAPLVAPSLGDEPRLIQKLVALEHQLLIPRGGEGQPETLAAQLSFAITRCALGPARKPFFKRTQRRRLAAAPNLPQEMAIPALPQRIKRAAGARLAHQSQIGHGQRPCRTVVAGFDAVAVAKSVKLFDVTELLACLALDPGAQSDLECE